MHDNTREERASASAGDIVALVGLKDTITGETLCIEQKGIIYDLMVFPETVISVAIEPKTAADEKKLMATLEQLKKEDPTFDFKNNPETGQLLIFGMGELHLEIIADRLQRDFKIGVRIGKPQVSYRETIQKVCEGQNEFKKDIGGKIQSGHAKLKCEPFNSQAGILFESLLNKRELPENYLEAIEKAIKDTSLGGGLAGYPFINIKVTLLEANYVEEEASEMAYSIAASMAFKEATREGNPLLMEPFMSLEVITPSEFTGEVIADINSKRGKFWPWKISKIRKLLRRKCLYPPCLDIVLT